MHALDHGRSRQGNDPAYPRLRCGETEQRLSPSCAPDVTMDHIALQEKGQPLGAANDISAGAAAPAPDASSDASSADMPTQQGPRGLRFDFNEGCRVVLPEADHPWRVRLSDLDTGNVLFETELKAGRVNSTKRYYVRFRIEAWQQGERVFLHDYSAASREVLIRFPVETLGDTV